MLKCLAPADFAADVSDLYDHGLPPGESTGWCSVDEFYTVAKGQWTLVTGIPSRGKSEFLDAMLVNLMRRGWKFIIFSPENQPHSMHVAKLLEKITCKPFRDGPRQKMTKEEMVSAMLDASASIRFLAGNSEFVEVPSLSAILVAASNIIETEWKGHDKIGLVIDPWNELDHARPPSLSETEYISKALSMYRQFVRDWGIHGWLVAHPKILQKDRDGSTPIPRPYDVSGSAHWYNKADNCITVHRDLLNDPHIVEVHIQKIRFKNIGKPGIATLEYDVPTGTYCDSQRFGWGRK